MLLEGLSQIPLVEASTSLPAKATKASAKPGAAGPKVSKLVRRASGAHALGVWCFRPSF